MYTPMALCGYSISGKLVNTKGGTRMIRVDGQSMQSVYMNSEWKCDINVKHNTFTFQTSHLQTLLMY